MRIFKFLLFRCISFQNILPFDYEYVSKKMILFFVCLCVCMLGRENILIFLFFPSYILFLLSFLPPFFPSFLPDFRMNLWILILPFGLISNNTLFCCSNCSSFSHGHLFWLAPVFLWHTPLLFLALFSTSLLTVRQLPAVYRQL